MANRTGQTIEITPRIKSILLEAHNKRRNEIAGGRIRGYKPAIRMTTIVNIPFLCQLDIKEGNCILV